MSYKQYLKTHHWKDTRASKLTQQPNCEFCNTSNNLVVHHNKYRNKHGESLLYNEPLNILFTLCNSCHFLWHNVHGTKRIKRGYIKRLHNMQSFYGVTREMIESCTSRTKARKVYRKLPNRYL